MLDPTSLNLRHLDALLAVDRLGGITAAAAEVNISQSALTEAIHCLEKQVGADLFVRMASGVKATEAGKLFVIRTDRAVSRIAQACLQLRLSAKLPVLRNPQRLISLKQIRAFLSVEHAGSYATGARLLGLSQPTVHRAVRQLEAILGLPLFECIGRSVRPTQGAERWAHSLRLALLELRAGIEEMEQTDSLKTRHLSIGALSLPLSAFVPEVLGELAQARSGLQISIVQGTHAILMDKLVHGEIDLLIDTHRTTGIPSTLQQEILFNDSFLVAAAVDHQLARSRPASGDLLAYPWLVGPAGSPIRQAWAELFPDGRLPSVYIECTSTSAIRSFLLQGNWLALLSADQFESERSMGTLAFVVVHPFKTRRSITLTTRRDWLPTQLQREVLALLRRFGRKRISADPNLTSCRTMTK